MRTRFTLGDAIASALTNDMLCRSLSNFAPHFSMCKYLHYSCRSSFNSSIASVMEGLLCLRHCPPLGTHSGSQSLQHLFFNRCDALIVECLPIYVRATTDQNTANAHLELDLLLDCLIINIPNSIILGLMQFFFQSCRVIYHELNHMLSVVGPQTKQDFMPRQPYSLQVNCNILNSNRYL